MGAVACDVGSAEPEVQGPPVHLVALRVATSLNGTTPVMGNVEGETPALVTTRFELVFDRFLDPRTAIRQAVCITSDSGTVESFDTCNGGIFLRPQYDPVRRVVTFYQEDDTTRLAPNTIYTVTVLAPRGGGDTGIRAFDGASLEATETFEIRTVDVDPALPTDAPAPADPSLCGDDTSPIVALLGTRCSTCHSGRNARMGLGLLGSAEIQQTAFEVAKQTQMGANADEVQANPARFGADMPIIAPGSPGSSYLLYKILARVPVDTDTLAEGETERLLGRVVVGAPMAPDESYEPMTEDELLLLSDWIQRGAQCE